MATVSISKRLLSRVLSSYIILSFSVTLLQVAFTYISVKNEMYKELQQLEQTISVSLSQAIWELNEEQIAAIGNGLVEMSLVKAVLINDEVDNEIFVSGPLNGFKIPESPSQHDIKKVQYNDLFGFKNKLSFSLSGTPTHVGRIVIFSSYSNIYNKVLVQVLFPIIGLLISILLLSFLIKRLFHRLLTSPLEQLSFGIARIDLENLSQSQLTPPSEQQDELNMLTHSFNLMLVKLEEYKLNLEKTKLELVNANKKLDLQNMSLEQEVSKKTANLSLAISELAQQKTELEESERELINSLSRLKQTQTQLVHSEKMASLGSLVAGISHEINTPVGIGVTAVSYLTECVGNLDIAIRNKTLTKTHMGKFIDDANNSCSLLTTNLNKASQLIQSFKDIAVDQTSEAIRDVNLFDYLNEVITSLQPKLKRTQHRIIVEGDKDIVIHCRAGSLSQMFTNLILNSLVHAFDDIEKGDMTFHLSRDETLVYITYQDNGSGVSQDNLKQLFEPFFTTKRGQGGSGLGTHILYNIVNQSLNGKISAQSELGDGLKYSIQFPLSQINSK